MRNQKKSLKIGVPNIAYSLISLGAAIALWIFISSTKAQVVFAPPAKVFEALVDLYETGKLFDHIRASLSRSLSGFALAFVCALPVAFLLGWYKPLQLIFHPWIKFVKSIPPISYIPLVIVAQGVGESAKVTVIFIGSFLVMVINIFQGVQNVDLTMIKAARVLGAKDFTIFTKVVIPSSLPFILVGMRLGLASSLTTLIAAELTGAQLGLGQMIQEASMYFRMDIVLMGIILIGIFGTILDQIVSFLERRLTAWQETRTI
ncbi:MAG: ABC transporter permease [Clostridiaceae bacterium]|nr:ABC transporter permease [Clostridiaceae bacterium]